METTKISIKERFAYGCGDLGCNIIYSAFNPPPLLDLSTEVTDEKLMAVPTAAAQWLLRNPHMPHPQLQPHPGYAAISIRSQKAKAPHPSVHSGSGTVAEVPVIKKVVKNAKRLKCNYLVFPVPSKKKQLYMETKGFYLIGQVNEYGIFKYYE